MQIQIDLEGITDWLPPSLTCSPSVGHRCQLPPIICIISMACPILQVSMGTLMAFTMVNVSVVVLRRSSPTLPRPFRCPCFPYIPILGAACCLLLMISLPSTNWVRLVVWFLLGCSVYFAYSRPHAERWRQEHQAERQTAAADDVNSVQCGPSDAVELASGVSGDVFVRSICSLPDGGSGTHNADAVRNPMHVHRILMNLQSAHS